MLRYEELKHEPCLRAAAGSSGLATALCVAVGIAAAGCSADFQRSSGPLLGLNGDTSTEQRTASAADDADLEFAQPAASSPRSVTRPSIARPGSQTTRPPGSSTYRPGPIARLDGDKELGRASSTSNSRTKPRFAPTPSTKTPAIERRDYTPVATGSLQGRGGTITVASGDTLYQLARRHRVSVAALRRANGLTSNIIRPGQTLNLPGAAQARSAPARTAAPNSVASERPVQRRSQRAGRGRSQQGSYTVQPGDSLYGISRRTGVSVAALKRINGITDVRALRPGVELSLRRERDTGIARSNQITGTSRIASRQPIARGNQVASRTDNSSQPLIRAKPIRTVPITRPNASRPAASTPAQPRILNQRPSSPIVTRPKQKAALTPRPAPQTQRSTQQFAWPATGRIIANFNNSGKGVRNEGVNIALPMGTDIKAADAGVVAYAGSELKGYGNLVLLRHDNGWVSAYAHASRILVKRGDRVGRGQTIAKVGRSGDVSQPQLHFELRKGAKPVDPLPHLAAL